MEWCCGTSTEGSHRLGGPHPDPNFILVLRDGSWLVSDDGIDKIYRVRDVADNQGGRIWRVDAKNGGITLIAEGMPNVASLVFGEGKFDRKAIYATSTEKGGGTIWKIRVGVPGARLTR